MLLRSYFAPKIFATLLVTLLIGGVRSFPALERSSGDSQPSEIGKKEASTAELRAPSTNSTDDTAALKASEEQPIKVPQVEESIAQPVRLSYNDYKQWSADAADELAPKVEESIAQPVRLDYYDYKQWFADADDELPALPDRVVNVNEDYAGIYDYKGTPDGRFRRKRTLTTNIEQFFTRTSRIRSKRSLMPDENMDDVSPAERAENLLSILNVMQDSDPEFDANEFLKVLEAPSVSEQDLEYLLLLSNLAPQRGAAIPRDMFPLPVAYARSVLGSIRNPNQNPTRDSFRSSSDVPSDDASRNQGSWIEDPGRSTLPQKTDVPRMYAITSLMSARGPSAGVAM